MCALRKAVLASGLLAAIGVVAAAEIVVGPFSTAPAGGNYPQGWHVAKLPGIEGARFEMVDLGGTTVAQIDSEGGAATLFRPIRVDPTETPILRWRWRIRNLIDAADIERKEGDDLPARLYVMFDYPLDRLSLIDRGKILLARSVAGEAVPAAALCYVWDGKLPTGTELWNPYSDRVRVVVVESGGRAVGRWVAEERNVAEDFRAAFGEEPPPISGVAIAADTDQTGETVRSWFGDIAFVAR
jgi:hypothetical protein